MQTINEENINRILCMALEDIFCGSSTRFIMLIIMSFTPRALTVTELLITNGDCNTKYLMQTIVGRAALATFLRYFVCKYPPTLIKIPKCVEV